MPEDVTSQENVNEAKPTENQEEVSTTNPTEKKKEKPRYQSIEEAEKAKNMTDQELDKFKNFTRVLTKSDAAEKVSVMYELEPKLVDRFYKEIYGKSYSETLEENKLEEEDRELREENPEVYELKKELQELKKQINQSTQKSESNLLDEFVSSNPELNKEDLEREMDALNPKLDMKEKLNKAVSILAGQGKLGELKNTAYIDAYKKQTASVVNMGSQMRDAGKRMTEEEAIASKFNDLSTFSPGIRKAFKK
jgi:hypothetical protein